MSPARADGTPVSIDRRILSDNRAAVAPLAGAVAAGFLAAAGTAAFLALLSRSVDGVFLGGLALPDVLPWAAGMLAVLLARSGLLWLREVLGQRTATVTKSAMRARLLAHLHALGPGFVRGQRGGDLANTVVGGVESLNDYMALYQPARFLAGLVPVFVLLVVLWIDPWTTLVLLFAGPILILLLVMIGRQTQLLAEQRFDDLSWMSAYFLDMLRGLPTLKQFNRSREQAMNIAAISRQFGRTTLDVLRTAFQTSLVLEWGATAATALVAVEVSLRLMAGLMPFREALTVLLLTPEFFQPLRQLALHYHAGSEGKAAARRIYAVLDEPVPLQDAQTSARRTWMPGDIRFDGVTVTYADRLPALNGLTLTLPLGRTTALVGPTGSGKTTVANLLLRFVQPGDGRITAGSTALTDIDPAAWRERVAWVPQQPYLFNTTVADNIRLGRPETSDEEVSAAARAAHAHDFIRALPDGYDTVVGEDGARLSGGQRQRIAIARAFLQDAPLVILDEATSHLDGESEVEVMAALRDLLVGRTALVIAHRLGMVTTADTIAVLQDGRVVAQGTYEALLADSPHYRALVDAYEVAA
jgi:ATP-binding cassette subfamily C protein CydD